MKALVIIPMLFCLLACSCNSKENAGYLPTEEAELVAADYLYFSKAGYELRLPEKEAKQKKISPEDYAKIKDQVDSLNEMLSKKLEEIGDEKLHLFFPKEKVETEGLDPRITISDNPR